MSNTTTYTFGLETGASAEKRTEAYMKYVEYASQEVSQFMTKNLWQGQAWLELGKGGV